MESFINGALIGLLAVFLLVMGFCPLLSSMDVANVDYYFDSVTEAIVESNYNQDAIDECCAEALANGYVLEVTAYGGDVPGAQKYAEFVLRYNFEIRLIGLNLPKIKEKVL